MATAWRPAELPRPSTVGRWSTRVRSHPGSRYRRRRRHPPPARAVDLVSVGRISSSATVALVRDAATCQVAARTVATPIRLPGALLTLANVWPGLPFETDEHDVVIRTLVFRIRLCDSSLQLHDVPPDRVQAIGQDRFGPLAKRLFGSRRHRDHFRVLVGADGQLIDRASSWQDTGRLVSRPRVRFVVRPAGSHNMDASSHFTT